MGIKKIHIFALAAYGQGLSGSDRIFIEFARRWNKRAKVSIWVSQEGYELCKRQQLSLSGVNYLVSSMKPWRNFGFLINYLARILEGIRVGLTVSLDNQPKTIVYSASEFWMDSIPAWILKLRFPKIKWVAAWYQTAPKPWVGFTEGKRDNTYKLSALVYWFIQLPTRNLINKFADFVLVNNENERLNFPRLNKMGRVIIVYGAVDLEQIRKWKVKFKKLPKIYDAVFQGRFHPQKGVIELIDIWRYVVDQKSDARLIMIGDGPLMKNLKIKIKNLKLEKNIIVKGYLFDGGDKYKIFSQSKIVLHPSFYDSGGMAAGEAMAFGLPCIGFDLDSYKSYYPKGMIKVDIGNLEKFANVVISLLNDQLMRDRIGAEGLDMLKKNWSWDKRAEEIFNEIHQ
ncbi:MAG: Glycosyl transferase family protein [Microgenomates group bacterium Gr01-1014_7]|nr:MAG: Glycosyl transferase family protein [Microgenomates group bacterium Gr01-1014_7]